MSSSQAFATALKCYEAGEYPQAEMLCHQSLAADPREIDAWNLMGVVMCLTGRKELALHHLYEAVRLKPDFADAHNNLGSVLRDLGRAADAIAMYERCLNLAPGHSDAVENLAKVLRESSQWSAAEAAYRRLLELRPDSADAHYRLGLTLKDQGNYAAAAESFRQAIGLRADHIDALNHLGISLLALGRPAEAVAAFEQVIKLNGRYSPGYSNLGSALWELGRLDEALACCRMALEIEPKNCDALNNLGGILIDLGDNYQAVDVFRKLLQIEPGHLSARRNLAAALMSAGDLKSALHELDQTLIVEPECAEARKNRGIACLLSGDYNRGWADYEWRWETKGFTLRTYAQPRWDGSDLSGRTILIYAEQGLGDSLHFVRYLPLVRDRGGRVVFECKPTMRRILESLGGIDVLVEIGQELPSFNTHAPLMSLPHLLALPDPKDSPRPPYLRADEDLTAFWKAELSKLDGFKLGINWQGRPTHKRDRFRSVPLSQFMRLADIPGVRLVSLQKGFGIEQLRESRERDKILELGSQLDETTGAFMDTAAVLNSLNLVITSDTSLAHLAGALGRPVWLVLSTMPDWRWLLKVKSTPWYPSMCLFRQRHLGDWSSVFAELETELRSLVAPKAESQ